MPSSRARHDAAKLCRIMCKESHVATNLAIDPDLLDLAVEVSGVRTKKAVVTKALQELLHTVSKNALMN